jgi:DNA polymerase-3 subunit alpha
MMATLSDSSGQFVATAFDDDVCAALEAAARAQTCGLLTVELDCRAGDEAPRVTIKRLQPLAELTKRTRLQMTIRASNAEVARLVALELAQVRGGNGMVRFVVPTAMRQEVEIVAGRDFVLDGELADRLERIAGEGSIDLSVQETPKLALVG